MAAQVDHPASVQVVIDGLQENFKAVPGIPCHGVDLQVGIMLRELQQQGRSGSFFVLVGRAHIIQ